MKNIPSEQLGIKNIYASNFLHTTLWAFVTGQRQSGKDVKSAVRCFIQFFGVEEIDEGTLRLAFYRKDNEVKKCMPGISDDVKTVFREDEMDKLLISFKNLLTSGK